MSIPSRPTGCVGLRAANSGVVTISRTHRA